MGHLAQLMREKKTSMHVGNLTKSFESVINITKQVLSLVSLIAFIMFNNSFGGGKPYLLGT